VCKHLQCVSKLDSVGWTDQGALRARIATHKFEHSLMSYNGFGVYTPVFTAMHPDDRVSADIAGDHEKELADMTAKNAVLKAQLEKAIAGPRTDSRSSWRTENENENPANVPHPTPHVESTARDNPPGQAQKLQLKCNLPKLLGTRSSLTSSPALLVAGEELGTCFAFLFIHIGSFPSNSVSGAEDRTTQVQESLL
jgi:hypothetical protein